MGVRIFVKDKAKLARFSEYSVCTLPGTLFSISMFRMFIEKMANEAGAKTNIQISPRFPVA